MFDIYNVGMLCWIYINVEILFWIIIYKCRNVIINALNVGMLCWIFVKVGMLS